MSDGTRSTNEAFTVAAPGKINLYLRVFPLADDGFHPLRSWFRTVGLSDSLEMFPAVAPGERLQLTCNDPAIPLDDSNLVHRAWNGLVEAGIGLPPGRVHLEKRIPAGGGLGGASSDAAALLIASGAAVDLLMPLAQRLGSDVPFFLHHQAGGTRDAVCTGRGEIVAPFSAARRHAVLLMLPNLHVSTPAVYRRFDALPAPPEDETPDFAAWSRLPALELLPRLRNDLERPAFSLHPELGDLRQQLERRLGRIVRMTGSGSTLFTLFDTPDEAQASADAVAKATGFRAIVA